MKKFGILSLALFVGLLLFANVGFAVTRTVCASGPPCGTYTTIGAAITAASGGDLISVKPGTYVEDVVVTKEVKIMSTGGKLKTFVKSTAATTNAFTVTANNVTISGFTIWGGPTSGGGVEIHGNHVKVQNCNVEKSAIGISIIPPAAEVTISNNVVRYCTLFGAGPNAGTGIYLVSTGADIPDVTISGNQIVDNDWYGILVYGFAGTPSFTGMKIMNNTLVNNGAADVGSLNDHNWNLKAIGFANASGTITLNYNKIQNLSSGNPEIYVSGGPPTFVGTGNLVFQNCTKSIAGPGTLLPVP